MKNYITPSIKIAIFSLDDVAATASRADMAAISTWEGGITNTHSTDSRQVLFEEVREFEFYD